MHLAIHIDEDEDIIYLSFARDALNRAAVAKTDRPSEDIALDFDSDGRLLGLEIMNAAKHLREPLRDFRLDSIVGVKEAAALLGVAAPNFIRDFVNRRDFPKPVAKLSAGRVWFKSQIEA